MVAKLEQKRQQHPELGANPQIQTKKEIIDSVTKDAMKELSFLDHGSTKVNLAKGVDRIIAVFKPNRTPAETIVGRIEEKRRSHATKIGAEVIEGILEGEKDITEGMVKTVAKKLWPPGSYTGKSASYTGKFVLEELKEHKELMIQRSKNDPKLQKELERERIKESNIS
jgi:hypothetical protein